MGAQHRKWYQWQSTRLRPFATRAYRPRQADSTAVVATPQVWWGYLARRLRRRIGRLPLSAPEQPL